MPVIKTSIIAPPPASDGALRPEDVYCAQRDTRHTGYCGTKVLELRHEAKITDSENGANTAQNGGKNEVNGGGKGGAKMAGNGTQQGVSVRVCGDTQDEERVTAIVLRTGFQTAKGKLVRSIMFPKPSTFKVSVHFMVFFLRRCFSPAISMHAYFSHINL